MITSNKVKKSRYQKASVQYSVQILHLPRTVHTYPELGKHEKYKHFFIRTCLLMVSDLPLRFEYFLDTVKMHNYFQFNSKFPNIFEKLHIRPNGV